MPPNADSRRGSHLREHLLFLLLLLTLNVFAPPALAQNAPPAPADKSEQQKAAYAALADLLQDDKARAALINHLKQAAGDAPAAAPTTPEESTPATLSDSLNSLAQEGIGTFNQKLGALQKLIDSGPKRVFNPAGFFRALGYFLLTVAVTFALFHLIRRLIAPLYKRMGSWGHNARLQRGPWYKRPAAILGAFAVDLLVLLLALTLYAIWLILHNRKPIQQQINLLAERSMAFFSAILRGLGHIWHLLAIAYFLVLFVLSQFDIGNSLRFMMSATVKSLLVVGVGALLSGMLTRWIFRRISLPTDVNLRYPMLERRINSYIPNGLKILRVMVVLAVTLFLLDAWHLINLYQWAGSENGQRTLGGLVHILLILLIAVFSWTLMASIIEHRLALELSNGVRPSARERTLLTLFRNVLAIVISTITVMIVLSQVGLNIAPLLAGAGALGLAISFGAQTLVKDVITGVFIQFENGMNTGEYVTVSGITGTVERMTIRSIGLRDDYGVYHIVPYSSITTLANYAREFGVYRANYTVSRDEDIDRVNEVLHQAIAALKQDEQVKHFLIGEPVFNGVVALGDRSFTTRVTVRTQALKQWVVQYALDRLVKIHFDRAGIGMPQQAMQISRAPQPHEEQAPPSVPGG
ncbi:TPA: mechanosensitive channel protein [Serratia marcescens]|nr:mechanosensitive channel protein [Serratia marcescens]